MLLLSATGLPDREAFHKQELALAGPNGAVLSREGVRPEEQAGERVLIPMDLSQTNHLKAYGVIFNHIAQNESGMWLLNYRGGSFLTTSSSNIVREARLRNVRVETISASEAQAILREVENPGANMAVVNLETVPSIAVYSPGDTTLG